MKNKNPLLSWIAGRLDDMYIVDMTAAERSIADLLVKEGYLSKVGETPDEELYKSTPDEWKTVKAMKTPSKKSKKKIQTQGWVDVIRHGVGYKK